MSSRFALAVADELLLLLRITTGTIATNAESSAQRLQRALIRAVDEMKNDERGHGQYADKKQESQKAHSGG